LKLLKVISNKLGTFVTLGRW